MSQATGALQRLGITPQVGLLSTDLLNIYSATGAAHFTVTSADILNYIEDNVDEFDNLVNFALGLTSDKPISSVNNATDTLDNRLCVYDNQAAGTMYGMVLWNSNGVGGDWGPMIFGPNQDNRRISFGKINQAAPTLHAHITEGAYFDLDDWELYLTGGLTATGDVTGPNVTSGADPGHTHTAYAGSSHNHAGVYEPANANIQSHIGSTSNPHSVTKSQVSLGSVENTALSTWAGTANIITVGNIITGRTELASGLVSTDELLVSDGGTIKRMDVSVLETYFDSVYSGGSHNHDSDYVGKTGYGALTFYGDHLMFADGGASNRDYIRWDDTGNVFHFVADAAISGTGNAGIKAGSLDITSNIVVGGTVDGVDVSGIPSTYAPISHNHSASDLTTGTLPSARLTSVGGFYNIDPDIPVTNDDHTHLSVPTLAEAAVEKAYLENKIQFHLPTTIETYNGSTWSAHSQSPADVANLFIGRYTGSGYLAIPNGVEALRIVWTCASYRSLNWLYTYHSTNGHSMLMKIEKSDGSDDTTWFEVCETSSVAGWPSHTSIPHTAIWWSPTNEAQSKYVRITFTPTWNGSYPSNDINVYNLNWYGAYPANSQSAVWSWNKDKKASFAGALYAAGAITTGGTVDGVDVATLGSDVSSHIGSSSNPHSVTYTQVGAIQDAADKVLDTHINWGTGATQVSADDMPDGTTNKMFLGTERTKLTGIETSADVTDATNVAAAGALMDGDFSSNGLMKRTGAGAYGIITDNSTNWNTAYTHSGLTTGNPHSVTKSNVGLGSVENTALSTWAGTANLITVGNIITGRTELASGLAATDELLISDAGTIKRMDVSVLEAYFDAAYAASGHNHTGVYEPANANIQSHIGSTSNPHSTTKSHVGLGSVENTAVSTWAGTANIVTVGNIISGRTELASGLVSTDELLVNDGGTLKRMDVSVLETYFDSQYAASGHNHTGVYEPSNANIQSHIGSTSNPHSTTKSHVGLGSVENTAISTWAGTANIITVGDIIAGRTALASGLLSTDELLVSDAGVIKRMDVSVLETYFDSAYAAVGHNHTGVYEPSNANIQSHIGSSSNPHSTTKSHVGLGSVENTAISTWGGTANVTTVGDIIAGRTALASGLVSTDELLVSDAGVIKKMDVSVLETYFDSVYSASGHNHTGVYEPSNANIQSHIGDSANPHATTKALVGLSSVENTALSTWAGTANIVTIGNVISGRTELASGLVATDELLINDGGTIKRMDVSVLETYFDSQYEAKNSNIQSHIGSTSNPHSVTKSQVGLGSVENTALSTWAGSANVITVGNIITGRTAGTGIHLTEDYFLFSDNGVIKKTVASEILTFVQGKTTLGELSNVEVASPSNGDHLTYNTSTSKWEKTKATDPTNRFIGSAVGRILFANSTGRYYSNSTYGPNYGSWNTYTSTTPTVPQCGFIVPCDCSTISLTGIVGCLTTNRRFTVYVWTASRNDGASTITATQRGTVGVVCSTAGYFYDLDLDITSLALHKGDLIFVGFLNQDWASGTEYGLFNFTITANNV